MKTLNRVLAIALVALLAAIPVATASAASVVSDFVAGATGDNTEGPNGFFGPYFDKVNKGEGPQMVELTAADGLVFDTSITDSWTTMEVAPQEMTSKKYATLVIKTDDVKGIDGFTMKFGGEGKLWKDWVNHDGSSLPALTTAYQTICVDLIASGVNDPDHNITAEGNGADWALNKGEAQSGKIYVKSITFSDEVPAGAAVAGSSAPADNNDDTPAATKAPSNGGSSLLGNNTTAANKTSTGTNSTGVEGMAIAVAVAAIALGGLAISKKVK